MLKDEFCQHDPDMLYSRMLASQQSTTSEDPMHLGMPHGLAAESILPRASEQQYCSHLYILFSGDIEQLGEQLDDGDEDGDRGYKGLDRDESEQGEAASRAAARDRLVQHHIGVMLAACQ